MEYNKDVTAKYFDTLAENYSEQYEAQEMEKLTSNYFRLELVKNILADLSYDSVFDAGCGSGDLLLHASQTATTVSGMDISEGMVAETNKKLSDANAGVGKVIQTGLDDLKEFDDESFDIVTCLGVLPYIPLEDEAACYQEISRILKKGGHFISAHQNQMFDLFTFNKYTVNFFADNMADITNELSQAPASDALEKFKGLMTNPDFPNTDQKKTSQRGYVFTRSENPLSYEQKLSPHGLISHENQYYGFHIAPPLMMDDALRKQSNAMEIKFARDWRGLFMASTFLNVAQKQS